jgi:MFS family permease
MDQVAKAGTGDHGESFLKALKRTHFRKPLLLVLALCALQNSGGFGAVLCFSADLLGAAGFDKVDANRAGIWMAAAICLGTAVSMPLMDRVGRRRLLLTGGWLVALSLLAAVVLFRTLEAGYSPTPLTARVACGAFALYGLGMGLGPCSCFWALVSELLPTRIRSMGMSIGAIILAVVTMMTQMVFLPLTQRFGYSATTGAWLAGSILFVAFVQRFLPETKGQTLEEIEAGFAESSIGC